MRPVAAGVDDQPAHQTAGRRVELLARQGKQISRGGQRSAGGSELRAPAADETHEGGIEPPGAVVDGRHQFRLDRNGDFRSPGRRWRADICGQIDQGPVGFVTDG